MAKILVLPETVQNKIAAGEVVERPSSVVKELVENALDAGAKHVAVEIEEGGHRLIRVSDDGEGMTEADLVAAMQRHATSKIREVEDIFRISSFGFRGEALPSIGSVSRLRIATCVPGAASGHELLVEGGALVRVSPAPPRRGTVVEVRDVFYNTPARRKFLRAAAAEGAQTTAVMIRLALGNPDIAFRLQNGDRITVAAEPAADQLRRIAELLGDDVAKAMLPFSRAVTDGLAIAGYAAKPPVSSRTSSGIYLLVNKRWIKNFGLSRALADAFAGSLPPRYYPRAVVNVTVDPGRVDVNVHPAKEEIRFDDESSLIGATKKAVREILGQAAEVTTFLSLPPVWATRSRNAVGKPDAPAQPEKPAGSLGPPSPGGGHAATPQRGGENRQGRFQLPPARHSGGGKPVSPYPENLESIKDKLRHGPPSAPTTPPERDAGIDTAPPSPYPDPGEKPAAAGSGKESGLNDSRPEDPALESTVARLRGRAIGPNGEYLILGQVGRKYILLDGPDGLLIIDPHALHERRNYDRLVARHARGEPDSQTLLLPIEFRLGALEAEAAAEIVPLLAEYGFEMRLPVHNRLAVTAIPAFMNAAKTEQLLRQVLSDSAGAGDAVEATRHKVLASLACRASVLFGSSLSEEDIVSLLDMFFNQGQLPTCPHGRPTAVKLAWGELAHRFGR